MKIILLASNPGLYSNRRLIEAANKRGHNAAFVNVGECYIKVFSNDCEVLYDDGQKLEKIDYVIPRIKPAITFYGTAIVRQFEVMGIKCLNDSEAITKSRDKLHTMQIMSQHGLNIPITSFANSAYETTDLIKLVGGAPLVIKLLEGTKGVGVVMAETNKAAESVINAFRSLKADILVQHYIKESKGQDIRCFVVGGQVIAAMERIAQEGEFRANIHLGATARPIQVTQEERDLAIKAAKIINLEIAGVDMVRSNTGPKILEINSSPGLEGIEKATGIDIADQIIEFMEKNIYQNQIIPFSV
jgi:ribosomal protein S6--L-glutamate ligase